ncbi:thiol reductant ABC exporter subunit CydC [Geminicoccus roseus]|uniref:thiol reductant ABC exporter subunit CydC n=1 Tax=Geminicoccus roseus TaxID=404900 RepID=UPI000486A7E2|nr:thiol reductant ABC exporter subunit CydC [Geminicoccus roseus]
MGLWYFRPLFLAERGRLLATLFLSILTLLAGVMLLGTSGWFLTAAATTTAAATFNLFVPSSLVRGLSLVRILSRYGEKLTGHDTTLRLLTRIRTWLFAQLFPRLPFDDRGIRHGDLVSRLTADVESLDSAFLVALGPLLTALIMGLAMTALLLVLLPAAGLVYAAAYLLALVAVPAGLLLAGRRCGQEVVEEAAELRIQALDGIDGHAELIAFGTVPSQDERFSRQARRLSRARLRQAQLGTLGTATIQALAGSVLLGVLWLGLDALQKDTLSGPMLVGLLLACLGSFEALAGVVRGVAKFGSAAAAADRLVATATAAPAVADPGMPVTLNPGSLSFEAVYYGYDPARPVLKGLDLRLEEGQRVAIVGASGTGKSTLADLALRLRDPQRGTVRIGGVDLRAMRQADLHRHVALLSQTAPVFLGTIRDNLAIGRSGASDAELWQALDEARLGDFVRGLPEALDTHLGEAGRTLSVGQARRLCLARTLLSPASILIFDEPTMGLDPETEQGFLTDLSHATRGRSVLLITHARLPAGAVDAVWRLVDGRLTEVR